MRHTLDRDRFHSRIRHDDFFVTRRGRVAFVRGINVGPKNLSQLSKLRHEPGQYFLGLAFGRVARRDLAEAFGNLRLHSRV